MENPKPESKSEFIESYITWLRARLTRVLPDNGPRFRMMEIARRQSLYSIEYLVKKLSINGDRKP